MSNRYIIQIYIKFGAKESNGIIVLLNDLKISKSFNYKYQIM